MLAVAPAVGGAGARPHVSASPSPVGVNQVQTLKGRGWPVIEFCRRHVRLTLKSAQNEVLIGFPRVRRNGRFTRRWTPADKHVGAGHWQLMVRMRCESGDDGSAVFHRASVDIHIR